MATLSKELRDTGEYLVANTIDDYPSLSMEQVKAWTDDELLTWTKKELDTTVERNIWVETCVWCNGTGHDRGDTCEACDGDGYRPALDPIGE